MAKRSIAAFLPRVTAGLSGSGVARQVDLDLIVKQVEQPARTACSIQAPYELHVLLRHRLGRKPGGFEGRFLIGVPANVEQLWPEWDARRVARQIVEVLDDHQVPMEVQQEIAQAVEQRHATLG